MKYSFYQVLLYEFCDNHIPEPNVAAAIYIAYFNMRQGNSCDKSHWHMVEMLQCMIIPVPPCMNRGDSRAY